MEFYKKNPKIKEDITVQGELLGDDTVVCGEEFKIFADPNTFPGKPVKLVTVEFKKLSTAQKEQVQDFAAVKKGLPPRHLGVIMSDTFTTTNAGEVKVTNVVPQKPKVQKEPEKPKDLGKEKPKLISEMFTYRQFVDEFPGITEKNSKKALGMTTTLEELSTSSNAHLRKMGINPSFYGRLRSKALELFEEGQEE